MNWRKRELDTDLVRSMSSRYDIDLLTASIMARRGVTDPRVVKFFLESNLLQLHNPFLFSEMDSVTDRILAAAEDGERVRVFGDRDADGIASTILMVEALRASGIDAEWAVPNGNDPYGLTDAAIDQFAERDGTLLISVDCGISNHTEIEHAAKLGIDTIVIDHHNPPADLPPAFAIINPKLPGSGYPFRDLSGCGVTAKVVWALHFARTRLYNQTICLLNIRPGNEALIVEAVLLTNLVEVDRIVETIVPGMVAIDQTRITKFLSGRELFAYDSPAQLKWLKQVYGENAEIGVTDIAPELWKVFPGFRDTTLVRIRASSRLQRYEETSDEIDVLSRLFVAYVQRSEESLAAGYEACLDLVALGTLADLMPLVDENRILVGTGLRRMNQRPRPALRDLIVRQGLDGKRIDATDVGWKISPLINATGRLGVPQKAVELFLCDDSSKRAELVDEILGLNNERKKLGDVGWEAILDEARVSYQDSNCRLVQVGSERIHRGITGVIAARLARFFQAPSFVVALLEDRAVGSARSFEGVNVKEMLDQLSPLFQDYGGHDYAAGYNMVRDNYERFCERLVEIASRLENRDPSVTEIEVDAELPDKYISPELVSIVDRFEPYGEGNPPLVFVARSAAIEEMRIVGKREPGHLRMLIRTGDHRWPAVFWNAADRANRDFALHDTVDIAFRLGRNYYRDQENLQLTILDIRK